MTENADITRRIDEQEVRTVAYVFSRLFYIRILSGILLTFLFVLKNFLNRSPFRKYGTCRKALL
jgi:hypothetical protein